MLNRLKKQAQQQDGFTLIELIVVVAILGILAAVLTPRVLDAVANAKVSGAQAFGKQLQLAMERYNMANNGYPSVDQVEAMDGTATTALGYNDLVAMVDDYTTIDLAQFDDNHATVEFDYNGFNQAGAAVADATRPYSYQIIVRLKDSNKTLTVTPGNLVLAD